MIEIYVISAIFVGLAVVIYRHGSDRKTTDLEDLMYGTMFTFVPIVNTCFFIYLLGVFIYAIISGIFESTHV